MTIVKAQAIRLDVDLIRHITINI